MMLRQTVKHKQIIDILMHEMKRFTRVSVNTSCF